MTDSREHDDKPRLTPRRNDDNPLRTASCRSDEILSARLARELGPVALPADVAGRMLARLTAATTAAPTTTAVAPAAARSTGRPRDRRGPRADGTAGRAGRAPRWVGGTRGAVAVLAAAAAVVAVVAAATTVGETPVRGAVAPVAGTAPEELRSAAAAGGAPVGALDDPARVRACLTAAGAAHPDAPLLAARPHTVDGRPAVLLVLGGPERGRYRLAVVPPDCGPGSARVLAETTTG